MIKCLNKVTLNGGTKPSSLNGINVAHIPFHNIVSLSCTKYTTIFFALLASQLEVRSLIKISVWR